MQATMIKVEMNARMEKAVARCKANHPKVRRVDASTVKVFGNGGCYTVRFSEPKPGLKLAACDCKAGVDGQLCYHVPAALACPVPALVEVMTTSAAPAGSPLPTIRAQSACSLVERIEQSYGGMRFKAFYCDGWPV